MKGDVISNDGMQSNFGRLSDKLKEADLERRMEDEEIQAREHAYQQAREALERKKQLMEMIPDETNVGTISDFMFKAGVQDILDQLDYDLVGLQAVKNRVREIASLLVVDKMRLKLGLETSVPSLHMSFTGAPICSTIETSSVTSSPSARTLAKPSRSSCGRMTWGVWISQSFERSSVCVTKPSAPSLTVAFIGTARTAAPCFAPSAMQVWTLSSVTSGLAASCTATMVHSGGIASSPFDTESCRSAPGSANFTRESRAAAAATKSMVRNSSAITITRAVICCTPSSRSMLCSSTGLPRSSRNCFGRSAFARPGATRKEHDGHIFTHRHVHHAWRGHTAAACRSKAQSACWDEQR